LIYLVIGSAFKTRITTFQTFSRATRVTLHVVR